MAAQNSTKQRGGPGRPWQPGQSGNPGGRPKEGKAFKEWCRKIMAQRGQTALFELAETAEDERVRLHAWRLIAEYAYGKPKQTIETEGEGTKIIVRVPKEF